MANFIVTEYVTALGPSPLLEPSTTEVADFFEATCLLLVQLEIGCNMGDLASNAERVFREWLELWRDSPRNSPVEVEQVDKSEGEDFTTIFRYDPS